MREAQLDPASDEAAAAAGQATAAAGPTPAATVTAFVTAAGGPGQQARGPFDPALLADITRQVDGRRGAVLSSGMEYPGRYSRWHVGYVDPCVEIVARGRRISARALNERAAVLPRSSALRCAGRPTRPAPASRATAPRGQPRDGAARPPTEPRRTAARTSSR